MASLRGTVPALRTPYAVRKPRRAPADGVSPLTFVGGGSCRSAPAAGLRRSVRSPHDTAHTSTPSACPAVGAGRAAGDGGGPDRDAVARRSGAARTDRGDAGGLRIRVPVADGSGRGRPGMAGAPSGTVLGGHADRPRPPAARDLLDGRPPEGRGGGRGDGAHRGRNRGGVRGQRGAESGRRRGASVPGGGGRRGGRRVSRAGRLVVPQQPRHAGRRPRGRPGRAAAPAGRRDPAAGRGGGTAAGPGGGPLPARRGRRRAARRGGRRRGAPRAGPSRRSARLSAARPAVGAGCRPRGPRRRPRPGCRRPGAPGRS